MQLVYEISIVFTIVAIFAALISFPLVFKAEIEHEEQEY